MKITKYLKVCNIRFLLPLLAILLPGTVLAQQKISIGIHADPSICWFSSDIKETMNDGARPGFNFGLTFNRYFTPNYSFSTGINIIRAGGRMSNTDTTIIEFKNFNSEVLPEKPVSYKINYVAVPIGIKLQTNQIGFITFFTDLGVDPKIVTGAKADIASLNLSGENVINELNRFNLSYHITAGIEYSMGGTTSLVLGLSFDNNFLDVTKEKNNELSDIVSHKIIGVRMGVNF
jgi:hypothetical protein